jgi:phosphate starvation-inducible PhoH-like protein
MKIEKKIVTSNYVEEESLSINIPDNSILMVVAGEFDKNLKELEKLTGAEIYFRGNSIIVKGNQALIKKVKDSIYYLIDRVRCENKITRNDVISSLNVDMINDKKNQSSVQAISDVIKTPKKSVIPRSKKQKEYM